MIPSFALGGPRGPLADENDEPAPFQLPTSCVTPQARADPNIFRCTLNAVPATPDLLKKTALPFGIFLHPFRDIKQLYVVGASTGAQIIRCRYCRTYINPFVQFVDGRHWRCNVCHRSNDVPDDFLWDPKTRTMCDPHVRPELTHSTIEYIAPQEYMLRAPQAACYVFVFDVSALAAESGYLDIVMEQMLLYLDQIPGDQRTQIAFIAVDSSLHFFQFTGESSSSPPRHLVVSDSDEPFLPTNHGLLANLNEKRESVVQLLRILPSFFCRSSNKDNCLGAALRVAHDLIADNGGRVTVFQCSLPNIGIGSLTPREPVKNPGEEMVSSSDWYKSLALEGAGHQVAFDIFALNTSPIDLATISDASKFSAGTVYHLPNFHRRRDTYQMKRFEKLFTRYLTRRIGFEAVLRIRATNGISLCTFLGSFFIRSVDLLQLPVVSPDSTVAVQLALDEKITRQTVTVQAALLYTSSKGDRRIRVHTLCLPVTDSPQAIFEGYDAKASIALLSKMASDRIFATGAMTDTREAIINSVLDSLGGFKKSSGGMGGSGGGQLGVPFYGSLRQAPLYALGLLKSRAIASSADTRTDERASDLLMLRTAPLDTVLSELLPRLFAIHGFPDEGLPARLRLSFECIDRGGVYLLEAGTVMMCYVSNAIHPQLAEAIFGVPSYAQIDEEETLRELDNPFSRRLHELIRTFFAVRRFYLGPVRIVKEDSVQRRFFTRRLVEDRTESSHSYVEFLHYVQTEINR